MFPPAMDHLSDVHFINPCYLILPAINFPQFWGSQKKYIFALAMKSLIHVSKARGYLVIIPCISETSLAWRMAAHAIRRYNIYLVAKLLLSNHKEWPNVTRGLYTIHKGLPVIAHSTVHANVFTVV